MNTPDTTNAVKDGIEARMERDTRPLIDTISKTVSTLGVMRAGYNDYTEIGTGESREKKPKWTKKTGEW